MEFLAKVSQIFGRKAADPGFDPGGISVLRYFLNRRGNLVLGDTNLLDAYSAHELVYACINKIADVMNDAEIIVEKQKTDGEWEPVKGHALTSIFKRPNKRETGRDMRRLMVQSEQATGIFYGEIVRSGAGLPVELYTLNPQRIEPRLNQDRTEIAYYEYTRGDGSRYQIKPENILIRRRVDLANRFFGLSPLAVALKTVNSDIGLTDYVDAFFESDGTPSGLLKLLNQSISKTRAEEIQADWMRKYKRGGSNHKGVAVLDQNADYQKIGANLDELDSENISNRFETRICSVFGVPPILVGSLVGIVHTTTNATAKSTLRDFWINKISPELASFREWLTWFVLPEFEDIENIKAEKIRVGFDVSKASFLQEELGDIHTRARENFKAGGWTLNEFREATGQKPDETKGSDYYVQPINLMAITSELRAAEAAKEPEAQPEPLQLGEGNTEPVDAEKEPKKELPHSHSKKNFDFDGLTLGREPSDLEKLLDLKSIVSELEDARSKTIKILTRFRVQLIDQASKKLDKLTAETAHTLTLEPDPKTRKEIAKAIKAAYLTGKNQVARELANQTEKAVEPAFETKDDLDNTDLEYIDELTDGLVSRIINEISTRAINQYLTLRLLLDYSVEKLRAALSTQSEKFLDQAASNTVNAAIQSGRSDEAEARSDQWETVIYSAVLDQNTCNPCGDADGEEAQDPADLPAAPNPDCDGQDRCRCFHVYVAASET